MTQNNNDKLSEEFKQQIREHYGTSKEVFESEYVDAYHEIEGIASGDFRFLYENFDKVCDVRFGSSQSHEEPEPHVKVYARDDCGVALLRFEDGSKIHREAIDKEDARDAVDEIMSYEVNHWVSQDWYSETQNSVFAGDVEEDLTVRTDEIGVTEDIERIVQVYASDE